MKANTGTRPSHDDSPPGRVYGLVITTLACFLVALSFEALTQQSQSRAHQETLPVARLAAEDPTGSPSGVTDTDSPSAAAPSTADSASARSQLTRGRLAMLAGIAGLLGAATLAVPRSSAGTSSPLSQVTLQDITGLPVLGKIFSREIEPLETAKQQSSRLAHAVVILGEVTVALAVCIVIYGLATSIPLRGLIFSNPLIAFMEAVRHARDNAATLLEMLG